MSPERRGNRLPAPLLLVLATLAGALIFYSQTRAFAWDEGFHLLTAWLIRHGRRPYIDFVFPQTPLNAYWNAAWMTVLGESWRGPHAIAAICSMVAATLSARSVLRRFPDAQWRTPGAILTSLIFVLNPLVFRYSGIAQAYGLCLAAITTGWALTVRAAGERGSGVSGLAGLACGIAADASLLTAPVGVVLLLWGLVCNREGNRWAKAAAFAAGELLGFVPLLWLFALGPRQVYFGTVEYNLLYRELNWPGVQDHNYRVLTSWMHSLPALLLIGLALAGLLYARFGSGWSARDESEFNLCASLSAVLAAYLSTAHPTFQRYFLFTLPFLSVLASTGAYALTRIRPEMPGIWIAAPVATLTIAGIAQTLYDDRDSTSWSELEITAREVSAVTRPDQRLAADEAIYFLTRHFPPSGMEIRDSHKFDFADDRLSLFHLIPQPQLDQKVKAGYFDVLQSCEEEDFLDEHDYLRVYARHAESGDCSVYWEKRALVENHQPSGPPNTSRGTPGDANQ